MGILDEEGQNIDFLIVDKNKRGRVGCNANIYGDRTSGIYTVAITPVPLEEYMEMKGNLAQIISAKVDDEEVIQNIREQIGVIKSDVDVEKLMHAPLFKWHIIHAMDSNRIKQRLTKYRTQVALIEREVIDVCEELGIPYRGVPYVCDLQLEKDGSCERQFDKKFAEQNASENLLEFIALLQKGKIGEYVRRLEQNPSKAEILRWGIHRFAALYNSKRERGEEELKNPFSSLKNERISLREYYKDSPESPFFQKAYTESDDDRDEK